MATSETEQTTTPDLADSIRRVRGEIAARDDVVVEMKQAARARLELLAQDLESVFEEARRRTDYFEFALGDGETPRLWIDMTTHVRMGRDPRSYEFVKDTRLGRTLLAATTDRERVARTVTDYIAERLILQERAIEGDWQAAARAEATVAGDRAAAGPAPVRKGASGWTVFFTFVLGALVGAASLIAWAWYGEFPSL